MTLEQHLKAQREKQGLAQGDLAAMLGFNNAQFISNLERGLCRWPARHFPMLSEMLGVDIEKMISMRLVDTEASLRAQLKRGFRRVRKDDKGNLY